MSASAATSSPLPRRGRMRHPHGSFSAPAAAAFALLLIGSAGCNTPLSFNTPLPGSGGTGNGDVGGQNGGVGGQNTGVGGQNVGVGGQNIGVGGQNVGVGGQIVPPPPDAGPDRPADNGPGDTGVPDAQPDRPPEVREAGVDANGPVVCRTAADCRFPTLALHCLIAGGQTTGSCVECAGDGDCAMGGLRRCDTAAGSTTFHRCVECMNGTVATDCPSLSGEHPSTCNNEHHCLQGCSDDSAGESACVKAGFVCQGSGGSEPDHQCADCLSQGDCATGLRCINFVCLQCTLNTDCANGLFCDNVGGRCVACRDSVDCRGAGMRLCDPAMHICVASN